MQPRPAAAGRHGAAERDVAQGMQPEEHVAPAQFHCSGCGGKFGLAELKEHLQAPALNPFDPGFDQRCPVRVRQRKEAAAGQAAGVEKPPWVAEAWEDSAGRPVRRWRRTQREQMAADGCVPDPTRAKDDFHLRQRENKEEPPKVLAQHPFGDRQEVIVRDSGLRGVVVGRHRGRIGVRLTDGSYEGHVPADLIPKRGRLRPGARREAVRCQGQLLKEDTLREGIGLQKEQGANCVEPDDEEDMTPQLRRAFPIGCEVTVPGGARGRVSNHYRGRVAVTHPNGGVQGWQPELLRRARGLLKGSLRRQAAKDGCIEDNLRCPGAMRGTEAAETKAAPVAGAASGPPLTAFYLDMVATARDPIRLQQAKSKHSSAEAVCSTLETQRTEAKAASEAGKPGAKQAAAKPAPKPAPKATAAGEPKFHTLLDRVMYRDQQEREERAAKAREEQATREQRAEALKQFLARQENQWKEHFGDMNARRARKQQQQGGPRDDDCMSQSLGGFELSEAPSPRPQGPPGQRLNAAQLRRVPQKPWKPIGFG
eukprot:TRINITY_DN16585_c0_g1_i1.p1 TRINITY_DN16585_c0_g1~~TRINITY_DN16585_c0_g1_i1.p1  ORF type:complete len:558 (+),score=168.92 TRINITY_DN16585_c0_g1_i1:59-1675(+)